MAAGCLKGVGEDKGDDSPGLLIRGAFFLRGAVR